MLQSIVIRHAESPLRGIDRGGLAEAIAFFGSIKLVVGLPDLQSLLRSLSYDEFTHIVREDYLCLYFLPDTPICASYTNSFGQSESDFDFIKHRIQLCSGSVLSDPKEILEVELREAYQHAEPFNDILDRIQVIRFADVVRREPALFVEQLKERLVLTSFGQECCESITAYFDPAVDSPEVFHYRFERGEYGVIGKSPAATATVSIPARMGDKMPFAFLPGSFLTLILDIAFSVELSVTLNGTLRESAVAASCVQHFYESTVRRAPDLKELSAFTQVVFDGIPTVDEAIASGRRNLIDLAPLVKSKRKFAAWAGSLEPDASLLAEYVRAVSAETWAERLPAKAMRFSLFSGAGMALDAVGLSIGVPGAATIAGLALGATDTFLVDKLVRGWKPSTYIAGLTSWTH